MNRTKTTSINNSFKILIFIILILTLLVHSAVFASPINQIDDGIAISANEIEEINTSFPINCSVVRGNNNSAILRFRILDLFTLKTVKARIIENEEVYLGGEPIGISLKADGVIITGRSDVITNDGLRSPTANSDIAIGDVLIKLNKKKIDTLDDIRMFLRSNKDSIVTATLKRGGRIFETPIEPALDTLTNERRLGLFIKEEITGVGTLTYIKAGNMMFGALGHNVSEALNGSNGNNVRGNIYRCNIIGVQKGARGNAGELRGYFSKGDMTGTININNSFGIYGKADKAMIEGKDRIMMASRFSAKPGKAEIWTTIDGNTAKKYEIEIIKLNYQKSEAEKGMVIRVTDKELLNRTGGIVQGMSGSPIVQEGKLIGAVTHVFLNDPTKGYGIYIDWMKDN